jgi:hypothetical protein
MVLLPEKPVRFLMLLPVGRFLKKFHGREKGHD